MTLVDLWNFAFGTAASVISRDRIRLSRCCFSQTKLCPSTPGRSPLTCGDTAFLLFMAARQDMSDKSQDSSQVHARHEGSFVSIVADISLICGSWLAAASIFGFGVGDSWVIYPERDFPIVFLIAFPLVALPLVYFFHRIARDKRLTPLQILEVIIVLAVIFAATKPLYMQYRERERYYERSGHTACQSGIHVARYGGVGLLDSPTDTMTARRSR